MTWIGFSFMNHMPRHWNGIGIINSPLRCLQLRTRLSIITYTDTDTDTDTDTRAMTMTMTMDSFDDAHPKHSTASELEAVVRKFMKLRPPPTSGHDDEGLAATATSPPQSHPASPTDSARAILCLHRMHQLLSSSPFPIAALELLRSIYSPPLVHHMIAWLEAASATSEPHCIIVIRAMQWMARHERFGMDVCDNRSSRSVESNATFASPPPPPPFLSHLTAILRLSSATLLLRESVIDLLVDLIGALPDDVERMWFGEELDAMEEESRRVKANSSKDIANTVSHARLTSIPSHSHPHSHSRFPALSRRVDRCESHRAFIRCFVGKRGSNVSLLIKLLNDDGCTAPIAIKLMRILYTLATCKTHNHQHATTPTAINITATHACSSSSPSDSPSSMTRRLLRQHLKHAWTAPRARVRAHQGSTTSTMLDTMDNTAAGPSSSSSSSPSDMGDRWCGAEAWNGCRCRWARLLRLVSNLNVVD